MDTLDKVVQIFVENRFHDEKIDADLIPGDSDFSIENMKTAIKDNIKGRIVDEIVENKRAEIDAYAKKAVEDERKKSRLIAIKELLWQAFILAIFVSLLGNELTTLIEHFKKFGGEARHVYITIILIIVYAVLAFGLYVVKFTKDIIETLINKPES